MGLLSTLTLPTLVAATPFLAFIAVLWLYPVKQSAALTAAATVGVGLLGGACTVLAIGLCAHFLAQGMPANEPNCVTGAAVFLPIGAIFTLLALLLGIGVTIRRATHKHHLA